MTDSSTQPQPSTSGAGRTYTVYICPECGDLERATGRWHREASGSPAHWHWDAESKRGYVAAFPIQVPVPQSDPKEDAGKEFPYFPVLIVLDEQGKPTLHPDVHRAAGSFDTPACHFWPEHNGRSAAAWWEAARFWQKRCEKAAAAPDPKELLLGDEELHRLIAREEMEVTQLAADEIDGEEALCRITGPVRTPLGDKLRAALTEATHHQSESSGGEG